MTVCGRPLRRPRVFSTIHSTPSTRVAIPFTACHPSRSTSSGRRASARGRRIGRRFACRNIVDSCIAIKMSTRRFARDRWLKQYLESLDPAVNRRAFLRGASVLATGALLPTWLAGCGSDGSPPTQEAAVPLEVDPNRPWWLQNNFDPVFDELDVGDLAVRGSIPAALDGIYVRNGSNPQDADNPHWFLGDGMLHGVRL